MGERPRLKHEDDRAKQRVSEKLMAAASFTVTALLFGYLAWQAITSPAQAVPEVLVEGLESTLDGDVLVHLKLANGAASGLKEVGVSVECGGTPVELTFLNVPARGWRHATLRCPAGTDAPRATVTYWMDA